LHQRQNLVIFGSNTLISNDFSSDILKNYIVIFKKIDARRISSKLHPLPHFFFGEVRDFSAPDVTPHAQRVKMLLYISEFAFHESLREKKNGCLSSLSLSLSLPPSFLLPLPLSLALSPSPSLTLSLSLLLSPPFSSLFTPLPFFSCLYFLSFYYLFTHLPSFLFFFLFLFLFSFLFLFLLLLFSSRSLSFFFLFLFPFSFSFSLVRCSPFLFRWTDFYDKFLWGRSWQRRRRRKRRRRWREIVRSNSPTRRGHSRTRRVKFFFWILKNWKMISEFAHGEWFSLFFFALQRKSPKPKFVSDFFLGRFQKKGL